MGIITVDNDGDRDRGNNFEEDNLDFSVFDQRQ
jgi:hypothetical protein